MALKVNYPKNVFLLRGNHESRCMTNSYNFMKEVMSKYNQSVYERFMEAFDSMPLACLVNKSFFCVHGGISDKMIEVNFKQCRWRRLIRLIGIRRSRLMGLSVILSGLILCRWRTDTCLRLLSSISQGSVQSISAGI